MSSAANQSYVFPVELFDLILGMGLQHQDLAAFAASSRWFNKIATQKLYSNIQLDDKTKLATVGRLLRTIRTTPELAALVEQLVLDWSTTRLNADTPSLQPYTQDFSFRDGLVLPNAREIHVRGTPAFAEIESRNGSFDILPSPKLPTDLVRMCNPALLTHLTWLHTPTENGARWPALPKLEWLHVSSAATVVGLRNRCGLPTLKAIVYTPEKNLIDMEDSRMIIDVVRQLPQVETLCLDEPAIVRVGLARDSSSISHIRRLNLLNGCAITCAHCHSPNPTVPGQHYCPSVTQLIAQRLVARFDGLQTLGLECRSRRWLPSNDEASVKACGECCDICRDGLDNKALLHSVNIDMLAHLPQSLNQISISGIPALRRSDNASEFHIV